MYEIKYAYPSSEMAGQLFSSASGCFYVELDGILFNAAFYSIEEARQFAESTGYLKNKWSM